MVSRGHEAARVLIVDDDELLRSVVHTALVREGYSVRDAENSDSALRLLRIQPVDLVILDALMDGSTLETNLSRLRALPQGDSLSIIVLSGAPVDTDLLDRFDARYLAKPVDSTVFLDAIRSSVSAR